MPGPQRPRKASDFTARVTEKLTGQRTAKAEAEAKLNLPTIGRRRCDNCGHWMKLNARNTKQKKFCGKTDPGKGKCKKEFHQNGASAFGPLKERLQKLTIETTDDRLAELVTSPAFTKLIARAGFIHRDKLKKRPPELSAKALRIAVDNLEQRLVFLEKNARIR